MKKNFFIKHWALFLGILIGYFGIGWLVNFIKPKSVSNVKKNITEMKLIYKVTNNDTTKIDTIIIL